MKGGERLKRKKTLCISERITNISELEKILENERIWIERIKKEMKQEAPSMKIVNDALEEVSALHQKATSFEFLLGQRKLYR